MNVMQMIERLIDRVIRVEKGLDAADRRINNAPLNMGMAKILTISSGSIEATRPHILLLPETGASDDLDTITNGADGKIVVLAMGLNANPITVRDYSVGGGNIDLHGTSWVLDNLNASVALYYMEATSRWHLLGVPKLDDLRNVDADGATPGQILILQGDGTWDASDIPAATYSFLSLTDTPDSYLGLAGYLVAVNSLASGLEFIPNSAVQPGDLAIVAFSGDYNDLINQPSIPTQYTDEMARDAIGLALVEGAGIDIVVDDALNTITIASTITQYTDEMAQDAIATAIAAGTNLGINITYNDLGNTLSFDAQTPGDARYARLAAANTFTQNNTIASTQVNGNALRVIRDLVAASTNAAVVDIVQDNVGDDQAALRLYQDGTGSIFEAYDGATLVTRINDGGRLDVTAIIRALTAAGLRIEDDAGNLGVFISDGGRVGIATDQAAVNEIYDRITIEASDATALSLSIINTGAGQAAFQLRRTGATPSRWSMYVPGGADAYRFYSDTLAGDLFRLTGTGLIGLGKNVTPTATVHIGQSAITGEALRVIRDLAAASTNSPLVNFINDNAGDDQPLLRGQQDGTGDILNLFDGATEVLTLLDGGNFGLNVAAPQGRFHAFDGVGGGVLITKTGVVGSSVVMIPNGTGDVTKCCYMVGVITNSTPTNFDVNVRVDNNNSQSFDDGAGNRLVITCNINGELSVARTLGTATWALTVWCVWQ